MKNQLQRIAPAWHKESTALLAENFAKIHQTFLDSTKKAVCLGIFLNQIKERGKADKSIPHGEFGPWLKTNLPAIHWDTVCTYMRLARDVCEKGKIQISELAKFGFSETELPPPILQLIEGKSQQQLFLEFKQVKKNAEGEFSPARGRRPGEGGRLPEPKINIEEIVRFNEHRVLNQVGRTADGLDNIGVNFMALADDILLAWQSKIERTNRCINEWLKTPLARRNREAMERVQKLYHTL